MSDVPQGPEWWQASDGRWYAPPRPGAAPPPPPGYGPPPVPGYGPPPVFGPPPGYIPRPPSSSSGTNVLVWVLVAIGVVVLLGMGACVALVVAVGEAAEDVSQSAADEADDVSETRCRSDAGAFLAAEVEVTNDSSERSNYSIEVVFESAEGDQIDTAFAFVSALEPGQSTSVDVQSLTEATVPGVTCRVTDVERYSDEP
jgi:hypothetical protein